jgi:hypothetical protein
MINEQFLETIPQYGIGGLVKKFFKNVKKVVKKVAPIVGGGIGFMIGGAAGAGIGAGIGGLVAGQKPEQALQTAMLGYGIGSVAGTWGPLTKYAGTGFGAGMGTPAGGKWAMGDDLNILTKMGLGVGADPTVKLSANQIKIKELNDLKATLDPVVHVADIAEIDSSITALKTADIMSMSTKKDMGMLGKGMIGAAALSVPATYFDAVQREKDMADVDPAALNKFYYDNPEEFQLANVAAQPYYYPTLQTDFGVPVEDLPTDFIRSAEGGTVQLANGTKKHFPRRTGPINGPGTGKSDSIPAMLSDGEFVMTAEAVRNAGGGNRRKGAKRMYDTMKNLERRVA